MSCLLFITTSSTTFEFVRLDEDEENGAIFESLLIAPSGDRVDSSFLSPLEELEAELEEDSLFLLSVLELSCSCALKVLVHPSTKHSGESSRS